MSDPYDANVRQARPGGFWLEALCALLGVLAIAAFASVPLQPRAQALFALLTAVLFLLGNRFAGRGMTMFLVTLSLAVSVRYLAWRVTDTLQFASWTELCLGGGLVLAELYAAVVLLLGYLRTAWPLHRRLLPLPGDPDTWPTVDVFIPTLNEPLAVVRTTVLAALSMDYPRGRHRVFLLDDGGREEFRRFAEDVGCVYLARDDNAHAKAGNLNAALARSDGEFVAVFDCDHIPTRAFLQLSLGWLVAEPHIAVVQTPQHCHAPDIFQRSLAAGARVPAEGNLFHGLVQHGNDFWNAALFTGTCAVLRRSALDSVGGFATETVTEDAHTMLRLHRQGWESAYLPVPLAAGLPPEGLAGHIRQRARWTRGMLQIFRLDNPLFGPGLRLGQRLCYLGATLHFLFALPRLAFLTAPLAFLLLGLNVIAAAPLAITAYALPHLFHAIATSARLHRNWRHSFWGEVYETVLALALVRVTIGTLLRPHGGRFEVTAKGGPAEAGSFDLRAVYPNLVLAGLLALGIARGVLTMTLSHPTAATFQAMLLNVIWAGLSLLVVLAALAVGRQRRPAGSHAGIAAAIPCAIRLPDGKTVPATTIGLSRDGAIAQAERPGDLPEAGPVNIDITIGDEALSLPAHVRNWQGASIELAWQPTGLAEEADIVRAVFGRADAWTGWSAYPNDRPLLSLWQVLVSIGGLFRPRRRLAAGGAGTAATVAAMLLLAFTAAPALGQTPKSGTTVRVMPQRAKPLDLNGPPPPKPIIAITPAPVPPVAAAPLPAPAAPAAETAVAEAARKAVTRHVALTLHQLGAGGPLSLTGANDSQGLSFGIRADEVVRAAQLSLTGAMSPALIPEDSNLTITLNGQYVGTIKARHEPPTFQTDLSLNPALFQADNRLNLRFTGRYAGDCNDPLSGLLWATVNDSSTLTLTIERLPPQRDLARLPQPFFDRLQQAALTLPFVLPAGSGNDALKAAGIAASWFGQLAGTRGTTFPVAADAPAEGNAVAVVIGRDATSFPELPQIDGPMLALVANPHDPLATVLVIAGRTGEEAVAAATALALGARTLGTSSTLLHAPEVAARRPYDAPNWIRTDRPVRLGELVEAGGLQATGYAGSLKVPFRTAPDFYTWRDRPFDLRLRYHAPPGPIIDLQASRLDVGINGSYLASLPLAPVANNDAWLARIFPAGHAAEADSARVGLPVHDVGGANDLGFYFDARPLRHDECAAIPQNLRMAIDPDSTLDLTHGYRFAELPNLAYFVSSGFPFTRMADLSETAVVLPERPAAEEIGAFLGLMGRFGAETGTPALRLAVVRPEAVAGVADRDLLVIATVPHLGSAADLLGKSAVAVEDGRLTLSVSDPLGQLRRLVDAQMGEDRDRATATLASGISERTSLLVGARSPLRPGRSVVALLAMAPPALGGLVADLRDAAQAGRIQGDLAILSDAHVEAFRVTVPYTVGALPPWIWAAWYFRDRPVALLLLLIVGCGLLGSALFRALGRRAERRL
jgi:cellulose synthase (UDP-forming)